MLSPVNHYLERILKSDMPDKVVFINHLKFIKVINIIISFINKRIYCEIPNSERSQILEKMCSLAWINPVAIKA